MDKFTYNPVNIFKDSASFPNPGSGDKAREQLSLPHEQVRNYINEQLLPTLEKCTSLEDVKKMIDEKMTELGAGDMAKSTYDTNNNGKIDADKVETDTELSATSTNPISNAAVTGKVNEFQTSLNGLSFRVMTESDYSKLSTKDSNTIYFLTEG